MTEKKKRFFESMYEIIDRENGRPLQMYGIIDLLNEQDRKIRQLEKSIERREEQISIIKKHCFKFLTDEQFETIKEALENE